MEEMNQNTCYPIKKPEWENIVFFSVTTILGIVGAPLYIRHFGISISELLLFIFYALASPLSITIGYHRLYAHSTYKASPLVQLLLLFFGAAAFEQSALKWASQHREHHLYVDTARDPYSIKKGFFYAHIGWLIFWRHFVAYENVKDLQANPLVMHQHRHYKTWAITAGILTPLLFGALTGHLLGTLLLSVCARLTLVYHATFCINSVCHMFGKTTYDIHASAKDNWLAALLTYGEGYHNFHHHFPGDYRNGVRWFQWDPTKWTIALLARLGLAWDLRQVSQFQILSARLAADHERAQAWLVKIQNNPNLAAMNALLASQYEKAQHALSAWEQSAKLYKRILCKSIKHHSREIREKALENLRAARRQFREDLTQWRVLSLQFGRA